MPAYKHEGEIEMNYLGIDVSKAKIDCCLILNGRYLHRVFKNDEAGFKKLLEWLAKYTTANEIHACLEATGVYGEKIADFLHDSGFAVSIVNPLSIHKFAEMQLLNVKTDKQDAKTIAIYCQRNQPSLYVPPPKAERDLKSLTRLLDYLKDELVAHQNRYQVSNPIAQPIINQTILHLENQINAVEKLIKSHIEQDEQLLQKSNLLKTVRGIGKNTIPQLLTIFAHKHFKTAKQFTAYLGLNPIIKQSGKTKTKYHAISKQGDKYVRTSLYMPAVSCFRLPEWRPFINRLKAAGKTGKQIVCAIMRKLAVYCFTVLKTGKPFQFAA